MMSWRSQPFRNRRLVECYGLYSLGVILPSPGLVALVMEGSAPDWFAIGHRASTANWATLTETELGD
jgi:hypothetical protein